MSADCGIACSRLTFAPEERRRYEELKRDIFGSRLAGWEELPDGYAFALEPGPELLGRLAEWMPLEHRCCPFLTMRLTAYRPGDERVRLELTGPAEAKAFLLEELGVRGVASITPSRVRRGFVRSTAPKVQPAAGASPSRAASSLRPARCRSSI